MFFKEDTTFRDLRERSVMDWLSQMERYDDLAVRGGVKVTKEYVESLKEQIQRLEQENHLKDQFLRRLKEKNRELERNEKR